MGQHISEPAYPTIHLPPVLPTSAVEFRLADQKAVMLICQAAVNALFGREIIH